MLPAIDVKDNTVKVNVRHLRPEVARIVEALMKTAPEMQDGKIWITSANDGRHKSGSLHYEDAAFDIRVWNVKRFIWGDQETPFIHNPIIEHWVERLRVELGDDYDVIYGDAQHLDHFHVEWDR